MKLINFFLISNEKKIIFVFFLGFLALGLILYKDFGFNIDEKFQRANGFYWLNYLSEILNLHNLSIITSNKLNGISSHTLPDINVWNKYGIVFDLPAAIIEVLFDFKNDLQSYQMRHLLTFLFFWVGSIFFYFLLRNRFNNIPLSLLGLVFLITTPRILGDSFHNNKDIIFLSLFIITIYFYFKFIDNKKKKDLIFLALFSALSSTMRILGIFVPISFFFFVLLNKLSNKRDFEFFDLFFLGFFFFIFLYIFWPAFWQNTYINIINFFGSFGKYGPPKIIFLDNYYKTNLLPYYYFIFWIFISSPINHIVLFLTGFIFYFKRFMLRFFKIKPNTIHNDLWRSKNENKDFLILICIITFTLFFSLFNVNQYNGWRLGYFVYIFIIYFIVYSIFVFSRKKNKILNIFLIFIVFTSLTYNIYRISIYHPYQSIYFNILTTKKIKNSLDVDFTGLSSIHFLRKILSEEENKKSEIKIGVASWYPIWFMFDLLEENLQKKITFIDNKKLQEADYIYSNRIYEVDKKYFKKYDVPAFFKKQTYIKDNTIIYEFYKK